MKTPTSIIRNSRTSSGFSLIELMVSMTIFAIVMTISIGTLLVLIDANAKAQALYQSMTNLSFAVDSITRNLRTANSYYCHSSSGVSGSSGWGEGETRDCDNQNGIIFTRERDGKRIAYRYNSTYQSIEQKVFSGDWIRLTSSDVHITVFTISVNGTEDLYTLGDTEQPRISILIKGYVENGLDTNTDFVLQSNVTQRILNY